MNGRVKVNNFLKESYMQELDTDRKPKRAIEYVMDIHTRAGVCPVGVVEESLAGDACRWGRGWAVGFVYGGDTVRCTEGTAGTLDFDEGDFLDIAASVAGRTGMYLRCYPAVDTYGDPRCVKELFFRARRTAVRFLRRLGEVRSEEERAVLGSSGE